MSENKSKIIITWLGHSCFRLECDNKSIVIDPYEAVPGYPPLRAQAGAVVTSHDHSDHGYIEAVKIVEEEGESPFHIHTIECFHDEKQGELRGTNRITVFEAAGLRIAHFGDIGHPLSEEQAEQLKGLDAALIPVGGFYTVDGWTAYDIMESIDPTVTIPMHYRLGGRGFREISEPDIFLSQVTDRPIKQLEENQLVIDGTSSKCICVLKFQG